MRTFLLAAAVLSVPLLAWALMSGQEAKPPDGQTLWRSCSSCHCVPDARIPEDKNWLKLNETTTCITGENDTPEHRKALNDYLQAEGTIRPVFIGEGHTFPKGTPCGKIRIPSTSGSAYLKAERESIRKGTPPKVRLYWKAGEKGRTLEVPEGEYRVISYFFYRTDAASKLWALSASSSEGCATLTIRRGEEVDSGLLPEFQGHLSAKPEGDEFLFGFFMTNRTGTRMSISREGTLINPSWIVKDAGETVVDRGGFVVT